MSDSIFIKNLKALDRIYPGQADRIRAVPCADIDRLAENADTIKESQSSIDKHWNKEAELHIIDRFLRSNIAKTLFDRIQMANLRQEINRRIILIEDRLGQVRASFEQEDWSSIIESDNCLFILGPDIKEHLQKLLQRHPDIAGVIPVVYSDDTERIDLINSLFQACRAAVEQHTKSIQNFTAKESSPFPASFRFFVPGHNYLQDASVNALKKMGYDAERFAWKNPLYRFLRSTGWRNALKKQPFDAALFLNATPETFRIHPDFYSLPVKKISWFVDNPRRYACGQDHYEECDAIGVFDRAYIPYLQECFTKNIVEIRTAFGIDPSLATPDESFSNIDIAFVGELGAKGFLALETGFLKLDPKLVETANTLLKDLDITQPIYLSPIAEKEFAKHDWNYQGALVEYLENKAAALRRRHYLDVLADKGLMVFGGAEWKNDPSAGPMRACYGGKRIDYATELPSLYASAKININIFHVQCVTAPNPRVYDVLASGGFLLTSDAPGLADEFENGKDLVVFRSRDELLELAQHYLSHPEERKAIAMQGQARALASCGYHDRMQRLLAASIDPQGEPEEYVYLC